MKFSNLIFATILALGLAQPVEKRNEHTELEISASTNNDLQTSYGKPFAVYQPKAFIISMFIFERDPWLESMDFVHNITIPGLSPIHPTIYCTTNYTICQMTTGEGEINAASSVTALTLSPLFDLSKTYFLIAGIAGGEPQHVTIGGVTFNKYAIQAGLQYQIAYQDFINTNPDWTSGYFAYGTDGPNQYPGNVYGTEVFEVNEKLRDRAFDLASTAQLSNGTEVATEFRALYNFTAARANPTVYKCDGLTSDNYFTGNVLGDYFSELAKLMTNGSATYCATAQEDNASLGAFVRAEKYGLVDYNRIVVMRTISNFSRPPPSMSNNTVGFFTNTTSGGFVPATANLVNAGTPLLRDILENWDEVYASGETYKPENYVGDIYGTLGGKPDFGSPNLGIA